MADLEDFSAQEQKVAQLESTNERLFRALSREKERNDRLVQACYSGAKDAYLTLSEHHTAVVPPRRDQRKHPQAALWHSTDWQGAKVTSSYNSQIMRERVRAYAAKCVKITEMHRQHHPVTTGIAVFGGDMVEGLFNFSTQPFEIDATIFEQWVIVSDLVIELLTVMLATYPFVQVISEWGNHGRIGSKRDAIPRSDNIDRMVYEHARQMLAKDYPAKRLQWANHEEDIQRIEYGNYRALAIHGDEAGRNGFVSAQTMVQHVNRWKSGAYPWDFRDVYVGHYHRHAEEPLANGEGAVYWTGSTESDNRYAREQMAASAKPSQRLHFIDPEDGRVTAIYKIWL